MHPKIIESAAYLRILKRDSESGYDLLAIIIFKDGGLSEIFYNKYDAGKEMGVALIDGRICSDEIPHLQMQIINSKLIAFPDDENDKLIDDMEAEIVKSLYEVHNYTPKSEEDRIIVERLLTEKFIYEQSIN